MHRILTSLLAGVAFVSSQATATVLFSDDFSASGSGTGFAASSTWAYDIVHSNATGSVSLSGGQLVVTNGGANNTNTRTHRALASTIDVTTSTEIWFSASIAYTGASTAGAWFGISFFEGYVASAGGSAPIFFGADTASDVWEFTHNDTDVETSPGVNHYSTNSVYLVARIQDDQVEMWINPPDTSSAGSLGTPNASSSVNFLGDSYNAIRLGAGTNSSGNGLSQLTVSSMTAATTFAEAISDAPDPPDPPQPEPEILFSVNAATDLNGSGFGTLYGGGIANLDNVVFDGTAAIMRGQINSDTRYSIPFSSSAAKSAPAVYVAASRSEFTGDFGVGDNTGSGWRIRVTDAVSDGATFYSDNLFPVFKASFDAANDTLNASEIYVSDMAALSSGTIRFVVCAGGNWYISEGSPNLQTGALDGTLTTSFSIEALDADWYAYDPTVMPSTNGVADIGAAVTPSFTDIRFIGFHLEVVAAAPGTIGAFTSCNFGVREFSAAGTAPGAVIADLDSTLQWLWENLPGGNNRTARSLRTDVIDHASRQFPEADWWDYRNHWVDDETDGVTSPTYDATVPSDDAYCDTLVEQNPVLYYLREAELNAVEDIRNTVVTQGVVIWQMYNMGVVVKTPSRTFAMDLVMRDAQDLVDILDFALVSHRHFDHTMPEFLAAMVAAGKPVITPGDYPDPDGPPDGPGATAVAGAITVESSDTFDSNDSAAFGDITIDYVIGDHGGASTADMGLCRVNCGPSGNDFVILHTGDGGNYTEFPKDPKVDLFFFHVNVGMSAVAAINYVQARTAVASHIMEMGHDIDNDYRWLYSYGHDRISSFSQDEAIILSWGERWEPFPLGDNDGNRLPDAWETEHFGITAVSPDDDSDSDQYSNMEEYIMGYDPNVAEQTPMLEQGTLPSGDIQLLLNTRAAQGEGYAGKERRYKIEHSTNLIDWTSVPGYEYLLGDDTQKTYTVDTSNPEEPKGFYRAVVWMIE